MFNQDEINQIEEIRIMDVKNISKSIAFTLKSYMNRILSYEGKGEEKRECFCAKPRRKAYHATFFAYYDEFLKNNTI